MAAKTKYRLGDLQLRIMQVLWREGSATVTDVQQALDGQPLAYTTVATMLRKMEDRGLVGHDQEGRRFIYKPSIAPEDVSQGMVHTLVDRICGGSLTDAVHHLLESRDVDPDELDQLEKMIKARRRQHTSKTRTKR
ncbi:MAG: BlaI/MecI/CopY family transcriptional regulator [Pirellulales bacterium]|nr:BlaI/MecI/CopY family transcriptional regulator [Pirellulales bacterium]